MERLRFRSTSIVDLQAELHQRELLEEAECRHRVPASRARRGLLGLGIGWRRPPSDERV